jgi:heme exporter protein D
MKPADEEALLAGLRTLRESVADKTAPASVETALRAEFRKAGLRNKTKFGRKPLVWIGLAAAAAVVLAVLVTSLRERTAVLSEVLSEVPRPALANQLAPPVQPEAAARHSPEPERVVARVQQRKPRRIAAPASHPATRPTNPPETHEVATELLRLPFAPQFTAEDRGQLVRVRLPRESMRSFGLPVNEDRLDPVVKADVLIGEDGIARAIRFVH